MNPDSRGGWGWRQVVARCNLISLGLLLDLLLFAPPLLLLQLAPQQAPPWTGGLLAAAVAARLLLLVLALSLKMKRLALGLVITILLSPAALLLAPLALGVLCGPNPHFFSGWGTHAQPPHPPPAAPFQTTLRVTDQDGLSLPGVVVSLSMTPGKSGDPRKELLLRSDNDGMISVDTRPVAYQFVELKTPDHPAPDGWYYQNRDRWNFRVEEKKGWTLYSDKEVQKKNTAHWLSGGLLTLAMVKGEPPDGLLSRSSELRAPAQEVLTTSYRVFGDRWIDGACPDCDFTLRIEGCQSHCDYRQPYAARRMRVTVTAGKAGGILAIDPGQRSDPPLQVPESGLIRQLDLVANDCNLDRGFFFSAQGGKLNGRVGLNLRCPNGNPGNTSEKPPEWGSIRVTANPRGSRNLRESDPSYSNRLTGGSRQFLQDKHLNLDRILVTASSVSYDIRGSAGAANRGVSVSVPGNSTEVFGDGSFAIKTEWAPDANLEITYDWPVGCKDDCDVERFPVAWLPGARGVGSGAVIPPNREREFLALTATPCPAGRVLTDVKAWKCCWPGQLWKNEHCSGSPERCPAGLGPEGNFCAGAWVHIPPGEFQMGCSPQDQGCAADEQPRHRVKLSRGFWMMRRLMTAAEQINISNLWLTGQESPYGQQDVLPAMTIPYDMALQLCTKIGGRLPTEAEWEYAARAGRESIYAQGDSFDFEPDHFSDLRGFLHTENYAAPVDWSLPNGFGLIEMTGNAQVWTADFYDPQYYAHASPADPPGPEQGSSHVMRGASYSHHVPSFRLSRRISGGKYAAGLRCVRDTPPADPNRLLP